MSAVFIKILNMSIAAGWLILAVVLVRLLLRKAPRWISCLLWVLVALRLVCPLSLESVLSLIPSRETIPQDIALSPAPEIRSGIPAVNEAVNPVIAENLTPSPADSVNPMQTVLSVASVIWIAGTAVLLLYALISWLRLKKTVAASVPAGPAMACDDVRAPFILGVIRPVIYVPSSMSGETLACVIRHEQSHIRRRDHWWKPLGYLLLSVYWFHPLCWLAYILLCRDIEAACDEKVIRDMDAESRAAYSQALLDCSFPGKRIAACPLAFGEVGVKERIKGVLNYKKPAFWIIAGALILCIAVTVCFLTDPRKPAGTEPAETSAEDPAELAALKEKYPEYFGLDTSKGLEVYSWQMSASVYCWGIMPGTDRDRTEQELSRLKAAGTEEMRSILSTYALPKEKISVSSIHHPLSSYSWEIDGMYIRKLKEMLLGPMAFTSSAAYTAYTENGPVFTDCLNAEAVKTNDQESNPHLPVYKLDTRKELERFQSVYSDLLPLSGIDAVANSFAAVTSDCDDSFFSDHSLLLVYVPVGSGTARCDVHGLVGEGETLCIWINTETPGDQTGMESSESVLSGRIVLIAVSDEAIKSYSQFDAQGIPTVWTVDAESTEPAAEQSDTDIPETQETSPPETQEASAPESSPAAIAEDIPYNNTYYEFISASVEIPSRYLICEPAGLQVLSWEPENAPMYDEAWFEEYQLFVYVTKENGSGSRRGVTGFRRLPDGSFELELYEYIGWMAGNIGTVCYYLTLPKDTLQNPEQVEVRYVEHRQEEDTTAEASPGSMMSWAQTYWLQGLPAAAHEKLPLTVLADTKEEAEQFLTLLEQLAGRENMDWFSGRARVPVKSSLNYHGQQLEDSQLLFVIRKGGPSSLKTHMQIAEVKRTAPDQVEVRVRTEVSGFQSADSTIDIFLIHLPKGSLSPEDRVTITNDIVPRESN